MRWELVSYVDQWQTFMNHADQENLWISFEEYYYKSNKRIIDGILKKLGISNPENYLQDCLRNIDLSEVKASFPSTFEKNIHSVIVSSLNDSLNELPDAKCIRGKIHLLYLLSLFDGLAVILDGVPSIILNFGTLAKFSDLQLKILISHEFHHAVRWMYQGDPIEPHKDIFHVKLKDSLISEGLAVSFSELVYPGQKISNYIPFYYLNPEKLPWVIENEINIRRTLMANLDKQISDPSVNFYFYGSAHDDMSSPYRNSAYYIGYQIIQILLKKGYNIGMLTKMSSDKILNRLWECSSASNGSQKISRRSF